MQTKFYFLLVALVGFSSVSSKLVAQTACYDFGSQPENHPGYVLSIEELASFGADATGDFSDLAGMTTYRIYLNTPSASDYVSAVMSGGNGGSVALETTGMFYQHQYGGPTANLINPALFGFFPALEYDSWVTIGTQSQPVSGEQGTSIGAFASWTADFNNGSSFSVGGSVNGGWFINGGSNGYAGDDNKVLLAQLTTDGDLSGALNISINDAASGSFTHQFTHSFIHSLLHSLFLANCAVVRTQPRHHSRPMLLTTMAAVFTWVAPKQPLAILTPLLRTTMDHVTTVAMN